YRDSCLGAVSYRYNIGTYEVTNAQYAEFLNAVATSDPNELYRTGMGTVSDGSFGGITRSGSDGSYTYRPIAGRENMPVNYVTFYSAVRFANWMNNGQPTGAQSSGTTEGGAYAMADGLGVTRNVAASIFLPNEDEWYKAAYYDALSTKYFDYPAGS